MTDTLFDVYVCRHDAPHRYRTALPLRMVAEIAQLEEADILAAIEAECWCGSFDADDNAVAIVEHDERICRSAAHYICNAD